MRDMHPSLTIEEALVEFRRINSNTVRPRCTDHQSGERRNTPDGDIPAIERETGRRSGAAGGVPVETVIWQADDFDPETATMEADDVAQRMGGKAFAAIPFADSTSEIFLLQGVGDPGLKCVQEEEEDLPIYQYKALTAAGCGGQ